MLRHRDNFSQSNKTWRSRESYGFVESHSENTTGWNDLFVTKMLVITTELASTFHASKFLLWRRRLVECMNSLSILTRRAFYGALTEFIRSIQISIFIRYICSTPAACETLRRLRHPNRRLRRFYRRLGLSRSWLKTRQAPLDAT